MSYKTESACSPNAIRNQGYLSRLIANPPKAAFSQSKLTRQRCACAFFIHMKLVNVSKQKDHMESMFHMVYLVCPHGNKFLLCVEIVRG